MRSAGRTSSLRLRSGVVACLFATLIGIGIAEGQGQDTARTARPQGGNVPEEAKSLVVAIRSFFTATGAPEIGAGVVFGARGTALYIATAAHVVQRDTVPASRIWVAFASGDSTEATLAHRKEGELDLAVVSVAGDPTRLPQWTPGSWNRRGNVRSLRSDDPVSPVGCPRNRCWGAPSPPDRIIGKDPPEIIFQSTFVGPGMSGGALFNAWWEVVGLVIKHEPAHSTALEIDGVLRQVDAWGFPVLLKRPPVPRGWYHTTIGAAVLASTTSSAAVTGDGRAPSGRVTMVRQASRIVSWHLAGLRLTPENLAVTAAMAGIGLQLSTGRFAVHPFAEAGFGHVEGRHDIGGYTVATASGANQYIPYFRRVEGDGLGVGGGMNLEVVTWPRIIVEFTAGYWSFTRPVDAPKLDDLFIGGGVRLGL